MPVLSGPNRGLWWISGTLLHGCWLGWYEKPCAKYVAALTQPGMTAFDIGANAGYYTLLLARRVGPRGRVIAFEPNPVNIAHLKEHLRLNKISNVEIVEAAVSDREGTAFFSGEGPTGKLSQTGTAIKTVRLDDYPRPDLVKIWGAENWACLASLVETCKLHGVDPQAYFADVLTKLINLWPESRLGELMPWAWAASRTTDRLAA